MPYNLKVFEWLVYSSLVVDAVSTLLGRPTWGGGVAFLVIVVVLVALTWAAARRGQGWAAWVLVIFAVLGVAMVIGEFWAGGPSWLREFLSPEKPLTTLEKVLDVISVLLLFVALYFYFFGDTARTTTSKTDRIST
jgi:hypothetical protein